MQGANTVSTLPQVGGIAPPRSSRLPIWRYVPLLLVGVYALTVPWPGNTLLPSDLRAFIFGQRAYWIALYIGVMLAGYFLFATGEFTRRLANPLVRRVLVASLLYPVYYIATGLLKDQLSVPVVGLYLTWSLFCFLLVPLLIRDLRDFRFVVMLLALGMFANWVYAFFAASAAGMTTVLLDGRLSYGYQNPNLFAQLPQAFLVLFVLLMLLSPPGARRSRLRALMMVSAGLVALTFAFQARSRNVMVAIIATFLAFQVLKPVRRHVVLVSFLIVAMLGVSIFMVVTTETDVLDRASSARTLWWRLVIRDVMNSENPVQSLLFGHTSAVNVGIGQSYSDLVKAKQFEKSHYDNFYLELLVEAGIVGTVLFLLPYFFIVRRSLQRPPDATRRRTEDWIMAVYVGVAAQGLFIATVPTFGSPLGVTFAVISFAPFVMQDER